MRLVDVNVLVDAHRLDVSRLQDDALAEALPSQPNCVPVEPGQRHLAAPAIESGSEWVTTDRDFSRFPGLRWRHPLDELGGRASG